MSGKIATPKSTALTQTRKGLTARKPAAKKAPAAKAAAPVRRAPAKAAPMATAAVPEKKAKKARKSGGKVKVVRDSFTMPQSDYEKIGELKQLCQKGGMHVKKSELLRAGLITLSKLNFTQLQAVLSGLEKIKTGRPSKG